MIAYPRILGADGRQLVLWHLVHSAIYLDLGHPLIRRGRYVHRPSLPTPLLHLGGKPVNSYVHVTGFAAFDDVRRAQVTSDHFKVGISVPWPASSAREPSFRAKTETQKTGSLIDPLLPLAIPRYRARSFGDRMSPNRR